MGKKKLISDEQVLEHFEAYYFGPCDGLPERFSIPQFGKYIRQQPGFENIADYLLRRCDALKKRIAEVSGIEGEERQIRIAAFRTLDVDEFLSKYTSLKPLRKALIDRDQYYKQVCASAGYYIRKYDAQCSSLEEAQRIAREKETELKNVETMLKEEKNRRLLAEKRSRKLEEYINTYVNPGIADSLLVKDRELKNVVTVVNAGKLDSHLITAGVSVGHLLDDAGKKEEPVPNEPDEAMHSAVRGLMETLEEI